MSGPVRNLLAVPLLALLWLLVSVRLLDHGWVFYAVSGAAFVAFLVLGVVRPLDWSGPARNTSPSSVLPYVALSSLLLALLPRIDFMTVCAVLMVCGAGYFLASSVVNLMMRRTV